MNITPETLEANTKAKHLQKQVFLFSEGAAFFDHQIEPMKDELGGKGAGLAQMIANGLNVPPGLTIPTSVCKAYYQNGAKLPENLMEEAFSALKQVEQTLNKKLGDTENPLLLSIRSGAKFSMPGMMDTILNLGLNDQTVEALSKQTQNPRFAWDSYRRFIQMFCNVVFEVRKDLFEEIIEIEKETLGIELDTEVTAETWQDIVSKFKDLLKKEKNIDFPQDTHQQLEQAIEAVFRSWNNPRAIYYRDLNKIDHDLGTAVNVQSMVFGNLGNQSGTGVCFTRNPATGVREVYGEYLINAQGEDVVAGIRTPQPIAMMEKELPQSYQALKETLAQLETHYKDMQDVEFTIQDNQLFILQTRSGKRTAAAAVKVAVDLVEECLITKEEAIHRVEPNHLIQLLLPSFKKEAKEVAIKAGKLLGKGLNASPGAAQGEVTFNPDEAERLAQQGHKVILVRIETCPDDIHGIVPAQGVLTARGGMTSHAAVVARGMGKPCVVGCEDLKIDLEKEEMHISDQVISKGSWLAIDGATGEIFLDAIETHHPNALKDFNRLMSWADEFRHLSVRANSDTPEDAKLARELGAEGIGLCRTEHMFMDVERLPIMQEMILADSLEARQVALDKLLPMQIEDFTAIFKAMTGCPVTIRLLDPPLHEFLPKHEEILAKVTQLRAESIDYNKDLLEKEALLDRLSKLKESNPMMGLRGCRLGLIYPEINKMQVTAIFQAACTLSKEGLEVFPEIMIPLVGHPNELKLVKKQLVEVAKNVMNEMNIQVNYQFGTMLEIPRACLVADELAQEAEFFSFGTNDLTQMTFGYSRDDAENKFLQKYVSGLENPETSKCEKVLKDNPFEVLDQGGVGKLMQYAVKAARAERHSIKMGVCGEHGGEPSSIAFAHQIGLDYVSCSSYRVPIARLAAAQSKLLSK